MERIELGRKRSMKTLDEMGQRGIAFVALI